MDLNDACEKVHNFGYKHLADDWWGTGQCSFVTLLTIRWGPDNPFHHEPMPLTDILLQLCSQQFVLLDGISSLQPESLWHCWWSQWIMWCYPQTVIQAKIYTLFTHSFSQGILNNLFIWCSFPNFILNNTTGFLLGGDDFHNFSLKWKYAWNEDRN